MLNHLLICHLAGLNALRKLRFVCLDTTYGTKVSGGTVNGRTLPVLFRDGLRQGANQQMAESVRPKQILELLHKQGFRCAYTGDPLTPETTGADHIIPVSKGGTHDISNIALVLRVVNSAKGVLSLDDFREMCSKVVAHLGSVEFRQSTQTPGELSDCDDPVEILTKLGYISAADKVQSITMKLRSNEKYRESIGWVKGETLVPLDEKIESKRDILKSLSAEISSHRVRLCQIRQRVAKAESDAA